VRVDLLDRTTLDIADARRGVGDLGQDDVAVPLDSAMIQSAASEVISSVGGEL